MADTNKDLAPGQRQAQPETGSPHVSRAEQRRSRLLWRIGTDLGRVILFTLTTLFFFGLAYVLGRVLLVGPVGNDSLLHIANAEWFDQFLPRMPNWFPLHGGGISIQRSYSVLPYIVVAVTHRICGITLLQAYRLISFISLPAAALSVYLFCVGALKNRTVGFIAGVLFLISPVSWSWIYIQGYLATTVAIVPLPLTLLCFERYTSCLVSGQVDARRRWWLIGLLLSFSVTALAHVVVAAAAIAGMAFYVPSLAAVSKKGQRIRTLMMGVRSALVCGLLAGLVLAFWIVPLLTYSRATNPHGMGRLADSSIMRPSLAELFSTKPLDAQEWGWYRDSSFPTVVGVLFIVGIAASALSSRKVLAIALSGVAAIGYTLVPRIAIGLTHLWPMWSAVIKERSFAVLASVVFPVVAAYGAWACPMTIFKAVGSLFGPARSPQLARSGSMAVARGALTSLLALFIAGGALYLFRNVSIDAGDQVNYGLSRAGFNVQDIWGTGASDGNLVEQLSPKNWPPFRIAEGDPKIEEVARVASFLPKEEFLRMDVSPYLGMYAQSLAVQSGASQINTYNWSSNLMWPIWGYQQNVFYIVSPPGIEYGTPTVLNEVADWFGTEFVFLNPNADRTDMYQAAGWEQVIREDSLELWHYPEAPGLATLSARPRILVIGSDLRGAYEIVFRVANRGGMPYREAFLVKGMEEIDSYSLEELRRFDAIFLEGYSYRDSARAWSLLDQYVSQGGAIYIDTGWQWGVPEWEFVDAPSVLPVTSLRWTNYGTTTDYQLEAPDVAGGLDPTEFAPLVWNGGPWGVSAPRREEIKSWGEVVLSANGQPLIVAGNYGEGRVVWSGMNLVAHALDKDNEAEIRLLHLLVQWLLGGKPTGDYPVDISRSYPDRVEFRLDVPSGQRVALYWREAYYPAWHAYLETENGGRQELSIYVGGPGFMLVPIEGGSGSLSVDLVWETPLIERLGTGISVLTAIGFLAFTMDGQFLRGRAFTALGGRLRRARERPRREGSVEWLRHSVREDSPQTREPSDRSSAGGRSGGDAADVTESETTPFLIEDGLADSAEVESLWDRLTAAGKLGSEGDAEARRMISRGHSREQPGSE